MWAGLKELTVGGEAPGDWPQWEALITPRSEVHGEGAITKHDENCSPGRDVPQNCGLT